MSYYFRVYQNYGWQTCVYVSELFNTRSEATRVCQCGKAWRKSAAMNCGQAVKMFGRNTIMTEWAELLLHTGRMIIQGKLRGRYNYEYDTE